MQATAADRSPPVLVVDGTDAARKELREALAPAPLRIDEAGSVAEALGAVGDATPDLVLAEVQLPDGSGFGLCRRIREETDRPDLPVMLVSTWATEMDRVIAFECGADDFVARPFFGRELSSRVHAVLRRRRERSAGGSPPAVGRPAPGATGQHREVRVAGRRLDLTPKETAILVHLATCDGAVRTRRQLIEAIWGDEATPSDRCIDSHVKSLRRKLGQAGAAVETVRGVGYRFAPHSELELL